MSLKELALQIAENAHKNQFRRGGLPYIIHPKQVATNVRLTIEEFWPGWLSMDYKNRFDIFYSVALLHDTFEDNKEWTPLRLEIELAKADNITRKDLNDIIDAVKAITKKYDELYFDYLQRVKLNPIARLVKICDIEHNLASEPKINKIDLYKLAKYYLLN